MHHPTDRIAHTMAFVTPVVEHWLEREIFNPIDVKRRKEGRKEMFYLTTHSTHFMVRVFAHGAMGHQINPSV